MTAEIVERVLRSSRYRDVDRSLLARLVAEELPRSRNADDAVKRVKRRLHQVVGAFRGRSRPAPFAAAWCGDLRDPGFMEACAITMAAHASTRERIPHLERFYAGVWEITGLPPNGLIDAGCGLNPLALAWMGIPRDATYLASDVDQRPLTTAASFLELVGQPHRVDVSDLVDDAPGAEADVALLLKLVPTLDRQDPDAATRLLRALAVRHAVVSFPRRSLAGRRRGMERTYRERVERLAADCGRVATMAEASVPNELVFVLELEPSDG